MDAFMDPSLSSPVVTNHKQYVPGGVANLDSMSNAWPVVLHCRLAGSPALLHYWRASSIHPGHSLLWVWQLKLDCWTPAEH